MDLVLKIVMLCFVFGLVLTGGNKGRHFVVTVPPLFKIDEDTGCSLYIASNDVGQALVRTYIGNSTSTVGDYTVRAGILRVNVSGMKQTLSGIHTKVVEIITNIDVAVYVGLHDTSAESFTAFPTSALSTSYGIVSYYPNPGSYNYVQITSIKNDTSVLVESFGENTQNITLHYMETLTVRTENDSTGAKISSTKPVNVITGCMCSNVPQNIRYCDPIYDSPLPTNVWGNHFIIPPMIPRTGFIVRILAETKQTSIVLTYSTGTTQQSVQFIGMYEIQLGENTAVVITDKRVSVMQYAVGEYFDETNGDPFMTTVPPITHFSNDYTFPSLFEEWNFVTRIAITIESQYLNELKLDERNISLGDIRNLYVPAPFSHYSVVVITLSSGSHTLKHPSSTVKFSALYYGFAHYRGHGLYLGYSYEIDDCKSSPCLNGATCKLGTNSYTCSCMTGYSGENCETEINKCNSSPCLNGATCTDGSNGYTCSCMAGYEGQNCETEIDECKPSPCQNNATCIDSSNGYTCSCMTGYDGKNCEKEINECKPSPCQNGATCVDGTHGYTCSCMPGYGGENCKIEIDECVSSPCQNGATCSDNINGYKCICLTGYDGVNCAKIKDECMLSPCKNNATCIDKVNGYECTCFPGYSGTNCETESTNQQGEKISMYIVIGGVALGVIIIALGVYAIYLKIAHKRRLQEMLQSFPMENNTSTAEMEGQHTKGNGPSAMEGTENNYFSILDERNAEENVYVTIQ